MADIPSRKVLPSGRSDAARFSLDIARTGAEQIGAGLAAFGAGVGDLGVSLAKIERAEGIAQAQTARNSGTTQFEAFKLGLQDNNDPKTYQIELDEFLKETAKLRPPNATGAKRFDAWFADQSDAWRVDIAGQARAKVRQLGVGAYISNKAAAINRLNSDEANLIINEAESAGFITPERAAKDRLTVKPQIGQGLVENIKPALVTAIETGDKAAGIEVLNDSIKRLVKEGFLTEAEGAQANKILGDWIDNYVAGRFKQGKEAVKQTTRQSYQDLMPTLFDSSLATQRYDLVDRSKLLKADKEKWFGYIKGSYKDSPTTTTEAGMLAVTGAVYESGTLQVSPQEAYDEILASRFIHRDMTDEQFRWAADKIENPYPANLIEDIHAITKSNFEDFNRLFSFRDKERNARVNESLLAWVDKLIEQDKVPLFDFKKKMYAMSSQFRVGDDRWYDVGQVIDRGGKQWEIVGFDDDGEPLVEEIE